MLTVIVSLALPLPAAAQSPEAFYRGKDVTLIVASGAGGGYDTYARAFAPYWARHILGAPQILPKNLPAAGGLAAASALGNTATADGLTVAALTNGVAMDPLFGNPGARFDALKLGWIGSLGKLENVCATWVSSPVTTIADARRRTVIVGAAGATSNTAIVPRILNELLGTRFKIVAGYDPGSGLTLALEGGEVEGICGLSWSTIKASRPSWIAEHKLNVLVQMALHPLPDLPGVPSALDLVASPDDRRVLELVLIRQEMGRPFAAPPGVPGERLGVLRQAFDAAVKDPDFLAEAARLHLEIEPLAGDAVAALLEKAYAAPRAIVAHAAALVEGSPAAR